ncbi:MAG: amidase family protein [Terrisporobacter othiniensis]|uniref:amidase family protein n=1 Tax=Terrisporobacter petrolearius TaxID=1460447 RepID=UPI0022DFEB28|nr:amidase family protein [Terrisporobacter petrolearius]MDU4859770.1 amidase family protein [Terrisporobacter othiniensis]MDU6994061.1 amidase family protein [Terrisporobacter othiniensis]
MKKFLIYTTGILGLIVVVVALNFEKIMTKYVSYVMEKNIETQITYQYDDEKITKLKNEINMEPFRNELEKMDNAKFEKIEKLVANANIKDIQEMYDTKKLTCEELVTYYLKRIEKYDINKLNSIMELNPDAIKIAREKDSGDKTGKLYGIPITLKGNIGTGDKMHTTAGAYALKDSILDKDSFVAQKLREEGAIILGKTNLSEWANYMSDNSSNGYSALGGQTHNAYGKYDVGGSSSGSASSVASGFSVASIGTETAGSMVYPSSQNSVVGIKPSIGVVSRDRIIPIVEAQDTAGIVARNVEDSALILESISGYDKNDIETKEGEKYKENYFKNIEENSINGVKVAVIKPSSPRKEENEILDRVTKELENMGAVVTKTAFSKEVTDIDISKALEVGFKYDINKYLKIAKVQGINNLNDIVEFNKKDLDNRAPYGQELLEKSLEDKTTIEEYEKLINNNREKAGKEIDDVLKNADVIVSLSNQISQVYAPAGYPALTVPAGYKSTGEPIGVTFVGSKFQEGKLIKIANVYEDNTKHRKEPNLK